MRFAIWLMLLGLGLGVLREVESQNVNIQQLSYGGEVLPPYKPPTTTTTTPEPTTTAKSSFFGGIKNWFRKNPTTTAEPPTTPSTLSTRPNQPVTPKTPTSTTGQSSSSLSSLPTSSVQPSASSTTTTGHRDYVNPQLPTSSTSRQPQTSSAPIIPTQSTPSNRRDYVNPNIPPSSPTASRPNSPPVTPSVLPSSSFPTPSPSTTGGRRDYVNPNLSTTKSPKIKEDFPALPPSRNQPLPPASTTGATSPSAWGSRPGSPQQPSFPTGTTPQSPWTNQPSQPGAGSKPTMVSFVPTSTPRPGSIRPGATRQPEQPSLATDDELRQLSETLLSKDVNNLNKYITLNLQGKTRSYENTDEAPNPLLQIDPRAFEVPTVAKMKLLFNNYELDTSINEYVTPIEKKEENEFIDAVMATTVMRQAMLFLQNKGVVTPDPKTHRDLLKTIWFSLYSRGGGKIGSSGFEHIFLAEWKNGTVTGLHNALYFNEEEKNGHIDYKGYLKTVDLGNKGSIVKYRFDFNGLKKPVNAMFVGTSPEFELALYTVCFEVRADKECPISLNGNHINLPTYTFRYRGKRLIGSAFPEI